MDFVNDDAVHHMLKTDTPHSSIWRNSALSIIDSLMSIVDPLKYDKELNNSFPESLETHLISLALSLFISPSNWNW